MKKILLISILSIFLLSCSSDDEKEKLWDQKIIGLSYIANLESNTQLTIEFLSTENVRLTFKEPNGSLFKNDFTYSRNKTAANDIITIESGVDNWSATRDHYFTGMISPDGKNITYSGNFDPLTIYIYPKIGPYSIASVKKGTIFKRS